MDLNFGRLKAYILPLSVSQDFNTARKEWTLFGIEISENRRVASTFYIKVKNVDATPYAHAEYLFAKL